jgi:hypothetical protein
LTAKLLAHPAQTQQLIVFHVPPPVNYSKAQALAQRLASVIADKDTSMIQEPAMHAMHPAIPALVLWIPVASHVLKDLNSIKMFILALQLALSGKSSLSQRMSARIVRVLAKSAQQLRVLALRVRRIASFTVLLAWKVVLQKPLLAEHLVLVKIHFLVLRKLKLFHFFKRLR